MGKLAVDPAIAVASGQKVEAGQVSVAVLTPCDKAGGYLTEHP